MFPQSSQPSALLERYTLKNAAYAIKRLQANGAMLPGELLSGEQRSIHDLALREARELALHALQYALPLPAAWPQTSQLLLLLTPQMEQLGYRQEWIAMLQAGIAQSMAAHDQATTAELQHQVGFFYQLLGQYEQAREHLLSSIELYAPLQRPIALARTLNRLAYIARLQRDFHEANQRITQALAQLPDDHIERAFSYFLLGASALDRQDWAEAVAQFQASLALWQQQGDQRMIAQRTLSLGLALYNQQQFERAIACFEQAISIFEILGDAAQEAVARMNLGNVKALQGCLAQALLCYAQAEPALRTTEDQLHLAMLYNNIGIVQRDLGRWPQANEAFQVSVSLWQTLSNPLALADTLNEWGVAYLQQGEGQNAAALFEQGRQALAQTQGGAGSALLQTILQENIDKATRLAIAQSTLQTRQ